VRHGYPRAGAAVQMPRRRSGRPAAGLTLAPVAYNPRPVFPSDPPWGTERMLKSGEAAGVVEAGGGSDAPLLEVVGVAKSFGPIQAVADVSLAVSPGEVIGLVGDNGAGKSTLVNIIAGAIRPSSGRILLAGREVRFASALEARMAGIETVYQDLALALDLAVWANIFLGRELLRPGFFGRLGFLDKRTMQRRAAEELAETAIRIGSVRTACRALSGGQRQAVAVSRGLIWGSRLLLLDEPTAALGVAQQAKVGELIASVRARGVAVVLVSHNMPQVHAICDRIVVLFRGRKVADRAARTMTIEDTVALITGAGSA